MNLYKIYLSEIKKILLKNKKEVNLNSIKDIDNIIVESPPEKFNYDFSSNAAMIIAKNVKINPRIIAEKIKEIIIKNSNNFSQIEVAGPGFLNFNLKKEAWIKIIDHIFVHYSCIHTTTNYKKLFPGEYVSMDVKHQPEVKDKEF